MKKSLLISVFIFSISSAFASDIERITDENIVFAYESRTKIPTDQTKLAKLISREYRRASDEFTKRRLMKDLKPVIKTRLEEAKSKNTYIVRVGSKLGEYDFKKKSFPSGLDAQTFIPFDNRYALQFSNAEYITDVPIPESEAEKLSSLLQRSRRITAVIYITLAESQEKELGYRSYKVLNSHISKVKFLDRDGDHLSTIVLPSNKN